MKYYPVFIPTLNRYLHFKNCVESLARCTHADKTELVIGLDYPPSEKYVEGYKQIKEYIPTITGFAKVTLFEHKKNWGPRENGEFLANYCKSHYDAYIGTEDDNVFAPAFLDYMNRMLDLYYNDGKILTVSGYNFVEAYNQGEYTYYLSKDNCAWGLGFWKHKEKNIRKQLNSFLFFRKALYCKKKAEIIIKTYPALYAMLNSMINSNSSWGDVKRTVFNILCDKYQVKPAMSLVRNCGYDGSGVHCKNDDKGYGSQIISNSKTFDMGIGLGPVDTEVNKKVLYIQELPDNLYDREKEIESIKNIYKRNINLCHVFKQEYYILRFKLHIRTNIEKFFGVFFKKIFMLLQIWNNIKCFLLRVFHFSSVPIGGILMLHRVDLSDVNGIWYNQHLKVSPSTIEEMTEYAKRNDCRFVSLDEMEEAIRKKKNVRRWIAVTLDDGYSDNYVNGKPVFDKMDIPYTIYVCTKMVKGEMLYWWEILEQLVLKNDRVELSDGRGYDCYTKELKEKSFLDIREIIMKLPQRQLFEKMSKLLANYDIDYNFGNNSLGLKWENIRELSKDPLCTIGNHTYSHLAFRGCTDEEILEDIRMASDEMEKNVGLKMCHFAFPFGEATAVSKHDVDLIKKIGFKTSATTNDGLVCYGSDLLELPRLFVTENNWKQVIDRIVANC